MRTRACDNWPFLTPRCGRVFSGNVYFEGDNGLQVRIDPNAIGAGKTLVHEYDDHTKTHTIRIRTATWAEKYKQGR